MGAFSLIKICQLGVLILRVKGVASYRYVKL